MSATPLTLDDVRAVLREELARLEARLRGERARGARRTKAPEAAARAAAEIAPPDDIARARARRALARLRER